MLLNHNIFPCLKTIILFVMLALFILGKKLVLLKNFDVYLQLVVEELQ
jgi:hypothetical protein